MRVLQVKRPTWLLLFLWYANIELSWWKYTSHNYQLGKFALSLECPLDSMSTLIKQPFSSFVPGKCVGWNFTLCCQNTCFWLALWIILELATTNFTWCSLMVSCTSAACCRHTGCLLLHVAHCRHGILNIFWPPFGIWVRCNSTIN